MCSKLYIPLLKPVEAGHAAHWWNGAQSWSKAKVPSLTDMSQAPCRNVNDYRKGTPFSLMSVIVFSKLKSMPRNTMMLTNGH